MRHLNRKVKQICMSVLSAIAGVSVAGCGGGGGTYGNGLAMYGSPRPVTILGKVTQSNGAPVEGIRVEERTPNSTLYGAAYTSADGTYRIDGYESNSSIKIIVSDVDGASNGGEFDTQTVDLGFVRDWPKQVDIVLQPKDNSAE